MRINAGIYIEERNSYVTKGFVRDLYLGCPINAVMHFNRFDYDEILIVNNIDFIDSFELLQLKKYSEASNKPKCYSGGIRLMEQAKSIIEIGFERVSLRSLYFSDITEYRKIIKFIGRQSVTLCLDVIFEDNDYYITVGAERKERVSGFLLDFADYPGEVFINFINNNGKQSGIDFRLAELFLIKNWKINLNYCGGIKSKEEIDKLFEMGFTAVTLFSRASTINNGVDKLLNNNIFYEQ